MNLDPGYGETPITPDEASALTARAREIFGDQPNKADLFEVEQAIADEVSIALQSQIVDGQLVLKDLLGDAFLRALHAKLYGDLWTWAGIYRHRELSIGIDPAYIATEMRASLQNIEYRWDHTSDWTARELGIAVHAETVRIHGFVDGNGRVTRLLADLVFLAAQEMDSLFESYDWEVDKKQYIALLKQYDVNRDPKPLAEFIPVIQM
ncbi:Fic family protein [Changpingibacter yushuensis]|uniref:Fic family protein n=1 Tax=Changpingibacter yushuensis TaxID=2758440 RepID=UPI00165EADC1|nr:Fic family protein [Changpingibacter yushuensis]